MSEHRYSGDPRYYPIHGLSVSDGDTHEFDDAPPDDGRWQPVKEQAQPKPKHQPRKPGVKR